MCLGTVTYVPVRQSAAPDCCYVASAHTNAPGINYLGVVPITASTLNYVVSAVFSIFIFVYQIHRVNVTVSRCHPPNPQQRLRHSSTIAVTLTDAEHQEKDIVSQG